MSIINTEIVGSDICPSSNGVVVPAGDFVAVLHKDAFADNVFEYLFGKEVDEKMQDEYVCFITSVGNPDGVYVVQGNVGFFHKPTRELVTSHESIVVETCDILLIHNGIIDNIDLLSCGIGR